MGYRNVVSVEELMHTIL